MPKKMDKFYQWSNVALKFQTLNKKWNIGLKWIFSQVEPGKVDGMSLPEDHKLLKFHFLRNLLGCIGFKEHLALKLLE